MIQDIVVDRSTYPDIENATKPNSIAASNLSDETEITKDRGTEKHSIEKIYGNFGKTDEHMDPLAVNYQTETVDFPESPKYAKFNQQNQIIEDETDGIAKGSFQSSDNEQHSRQGKLLRHIPFSTEGITLHDSFSSDKEEYFEDDLVTGKLGTSSLISDESLSSEDDDDDDELSADQLQFVAKQGLSNSTECEYDSDMSLKMFNNSDNHCNGVSLRTEQKTEKSNKNHNSKNGNVTEGFLFDEKASEDMPDGALVRKVRSCFDMDKIKDIYTLSGRLQDILSPVEIEEIVTRSEIYSEFIDDDIIEMLSVARQEKMNSLVILEETKTENNRKTIPVCRDKLNLDVIDDIKIRAVFEDQKRSGEKTVANSRPTENKFRESTLKENIVKVAPSGNLRAFFEESLVKSTSTLKKISPTSDNLPINAVSVLHNESTVLPNQSLLLNVKSLESDSFVKLNPTPILKSDGTIEMMKISDNRQYEKSIEKDTLINNIKNANNSLPPNANNIQKNYETVDNELKVTERNEKIIEKLKIQKDHPSNLNSSGNMRRKKKISVNRDILDSDEHDDDQKSLSSLSNKSDADVFSPVDDLITPDDIETPDINESVLECAGSSPSELIPEFSAAEEMDEERSWKTCFVGGVKRKIDMKVIEPYKKVLSHGGYFGPTRNAIIVFSACFLPDRSRRDYDYVMDNLFLYVLITLDQLVAEDYVLLYLHGATQRSNMPSFGWLKRCYQMIDRRLRKNLKGLYLVHPTFWLKTIVIMTRPFISSKFSRKLQFVSSLQELSDLIPMDHVCIPDKVKEIEFHQQIRQKKKQAKSRSIGPRQTIVAK